MHQIIQFVSEESEIQKYNFFSMKLLNFIVHLNKFITGLQTTSCLYGTSDSLEGKQIDFFKFSLELL